jgi:sugar porter (SP) family MFS transporter
MNKDGTIDLAQDRSSVLYLSMICSVVALSGLLLGYDTAVISGAIGFIQTRFGLDPSGMGWAASCALAGCVVGVALAGILSDWLGRKKVLILAAFFFLVSALGTAFPRTLTEFILFRILGGIAIGAASMTSPMYIAEISPARVRGRMVSINQFAIVIGMLVVYFVNYFIANQGTEDWNVQVGWRWMFGLGSLPAILLFVALFFVPESPRWLIKQQREDQAMNILSRVGGKRHAEVELAEIKDAIARESGSVSQLFHPGMRIVLMIGIALAVLQQITGINVFLYYGPEIFKKMGTGTNAALLQTAVVGSVNLLFTVAAIWTVDRIGRKPLMLMGSAGMGISLFALGFAAFYRQEELWVLIFMLGYIASFAFSVGPVTWVILSEIFPTRIRGRAMSIATLCLWAANFVVSQTFPMMNENTWLVEKFHHAFPFWTYGSLCAVLLLFVFFFVPETKGKSLEEIEKCWIK